ncbi:hypothetical protein [Microbacterium flavum]|uniref:hypothetical protein n=1 Tax=Microbacterium flavum TaxID=415216 RepID=UPI0024AD9F49|nr:hypothetical protein [Microbacterium flavum]
MSGAPPILDILLEIFSWVGFSGFALLLAVAVVIWAADGTWLPAEALVDHDEGATVVRWFDADGDANSATVHAADAAHLAGLDTTPIWYRHGWQGRMRLTRRPPGLRPVLLTAGGLLALGAVSVIASVVLYFSQA